MKNYLNRITINSTRLDSEPCLRSMRISVQTILEFLNTGNPYEEIPEQFPTLTKEDTIARLQYAARVTGKEISINLSPGASIYY
ncbi:MAG: DUF433 domain-containing protein [Bacteroidota bacterium]|nr:DUF433 domain-containing protein [Flavisolibacter sp.]MDQ3844602.1 DUF433 domain-containing protein [Bacteroidota bacterium]MBD0288352.1 DUF433 domain-containing protein [Flavisolibacter sp.]MBD0296129.1 DUF433 domain-containing protein [Flavisolibacter sp.]MBD0351710.1 DUF433 domain-containing protein [Flavisolibacter sp.]